MQYHVAKNGEKFGPLDKDEVYRRLVAGELLGTDLGWHEGLAGWEPLAKLLPPPLTQPVFAELGIFGSTPAPFALSSSARQETSGLAIASLVCGILGLLLFLPSIPAIILGHLGRSEIKSSPGTRTGAGMALAGLIMGYLGLVWIAIFCSLAVPDFTKVQQQAEQITVVNHARRLVRALKTYSAEHEGKYPPTLDTLFDGQILTQADRKLLEFPPQMNVRGQEWEYHGAELTESSPGDAILLISKKPDHAKKKIVARNDGSVVVEGARE
jgi:hypothetical protein